MLNKKLDKILPKVQKPGRYVGGGPSAGNTDQVEDYVGFADWYREP